MPRLTKRSSGQSDSPESNQGHRAGAVLLLLPLNPPSGGGEPRCPPSASLPPGTLLLVVGAAAMAAGEACQALVYGGRGALGSACVRHLRSKNWWVLSIDLAENQEASANVVVQMGDSFVEQAEQVTEDVGKVLGEKKVDAILCVAGGWAGGSAKAKSLYKNSDLMWKQSVWTSTISSHLATKYLKEGGLLTLTGAKAALAGTPGMIAYGMAKGAVHQLCQSLSGSNSGLPAGAAAVAILPVTLDTPMNRKSMPEADFSSWTPLDFIAGIFYDWIIGKNRPDSGSLIEVVTTGGKSELSLAHL